MEDTRNHSQHPGEQTVEARPSQSAPLLFIVSPTHTYIYKKRQKTTTFNSITHRKTHAEAALRLNSLASLFIKMSHKLCGGFLWWGRNAITVTLVNALQSQPADKCVIESWNRRRPITFKLKAFIKRLWNHAFIQVHSTLKHCSLWPLSVQSSLCGSMLNMVVEWQSTERLKMSSWMLQHASFLWGFLMRVCFSVYGRSVKSNL